MPSRLDKELLSGPNRSQFGTGLAWMPYNYLPVSFYCAIDRCNRSTSLSFRFQRSLRSHSFMVHSLPPSIAHVSIVDPQYSQYRLPSSSRSTPELLKGQFRHVPSSTHLVSLVFMAGIIFRLALSFCPRTLISKTFIHDSMSSPYIGCLPPIEPQESGGATCELLNVQYQRALRGQRRAGMCKSVKYPENLLLIPDQERRQRCLASRR